MKRKTTTLQEQIGYKFKDTPLLERALTHRSAHSKNNERLEFLGDAVLGMVIATELVQSFPEADEGQLSRMRSALVKGQTLAEVGKLMSLGDLLALGTGELKSGGFRRDSILAGAVEAVFGAVYLDGGLEAARDVILRALAPFIVSASPDAVEKDPKTQLQEHLQGIKKPLPVYRLVETMGAAHRQLFKVTCEVAGLSEPTHGQGESRRAAEQEAAAQALVALGLAT